MGSLRGPFLLETSTRLASPAPPPEPGAPRGAAPQGRAPTHPVSAAERQQRRRPVSQTPSPASPACPTPPLGPEELGQRAEKHEGRGRNGDRETRAVTGAEHSAAQGSERDSPEKPDRKRPTSGHQQIQVGTKHDFHGLKSVNSVLAVRLISSFVLDMQV